MNNHRFIQALFTERGHDAGLLFLRIVISIATLMHGVPKIINFGTLVKTFNPIGLGGPLSLSLIIFAEVFCAVLLMVGFLTRLAVIPMIIGMFVAAFFANSVFHWESSQLPLIFMSIFIVFLMAGAGRYSIDGLLVEKNAVNVLESREKILDETD